MAASTVPRKRWVVLGSLRCHQSSLLSCAVLKILLHERRHRSPETPTVPAATTSATMIKRSRPHVPHVSSSAGRTSWKPWEHPQPKATSPVRPYKKRKQDHQHRSHPGESMSFEDHLISLLSHDAELLSCVRSHIYLLANPSPSSSTNDPERTSKHALARRRRVPANAEEWDIPFPFPPGCAPIGYMEKWYAGRTKSLSDEMSSLIRRATIVAEGTRLKNIEIDPLAGWDEGPASDRARAVGVAPMILQWLERAQEVQANGMGVDLSNLPSTPGTLPGWPIFNPTLMPFTLEQLTTILEHSIAFARGKSPPVATNDSHTPFTAQVNVELPQFDFSLLDDLFSTTENMRTSPETQSSSTRFNFFLPTPSASSGSLSPRTSELELPTPDNQSVIPYFALDPALAPPSPHFPPSTSMGTPDQAALDPNLPIDFTAFDRFFAMFDSSAPSPASSSMSLPQSRVSSHPSSISAGTQGSRRITGAGAGKDTAATGRTADGSGRGNAKSQSDVRARAQAVRDKLQQEYDAVEKQLWACTVEEGVLINLAKALSKNS
ncbi:hypothetical protein BS47DRAFT_865009 [Hydnum rufescens UP504]|uniref:Uncharacterized protein n=1 Tax=Hydnum rufescens UP504 TaxID=1448309 RepID=A0A9P6AZK4_9AGAM|nr:hypothetical protein BS47DRAFT_865009 [Hydnum rufescens UP504]